MLNKEVQFSNSQILYLFFKNNLKLLKNKNSLVAVSGGPDSLALTALSKEYNQENSTKFYYLLIDHNIIKKPQKKL